MSMEELKQDAAEFAKLLEAATRTRVKDALHEAKHKVDMEIINLEMKAKAAMQKATEGGEGGVGIDHRRYFIELTEYAWDQSAKYIKLFINLDGVQNIPEGDVVTEFTEKTMNLRVEKLNGKDYGLTVNNLLEEINVDESYHKVKTGLVAVYMKKCVEKHWDHLTTVQKRVKDKRNAELNPEEAESGDGDKALFNILKKLYTGGDDKTKQMIAKAWTESHEKNNTNSMMPPSQDMDV